MEPIDLGRILDIATAVAVAVTLWATGLGLGISVRMSEIVHALARRRLIARVVALDLVLVPLAMWACVGLLVPDDGLATGLLLVAFAAAGPLGIKLVQVAGGDAALAVGLVVVLELANLLAIPLWSSLLGVASSPTWRSTSSGPSHCSFWPRSRLVSLSPGGSGSWADDVWSGQRP